MVGVDGSARRGLVIPKRAPMSFRAERGSSTHTTSDAALRFFTPLRSVQNDMGLPLTSFPRARE